MSQYAGYATDGCTTAACQTALAAPTSLSQGDMFAKMTETFHGGRRSRRLATRKDRKNRKGSRRLAKRKDRKGSRRLATRKSSRRAQRGGAGADYPNEFSVSLPADMHAAARIGSLDAAFAQLPEFVGKYGNQTGGGRRRTARRAQRGGVAPVSAPAMILTPQEEPAAFLNPQWYTENQVIPSFQGPANPYAAQQQPQFAYAQKAGRRRKASRKASRKMNRKHRK